MKASTKFHLCLNVILHTFVLSNISSDDIDENSLSVANLMKIPNSLVCKDSMSNYQFLLSVTA